MNKPSLFASVIGIGLIVSAPFFAAATLAGELEKSLTIASLEKSVDAEKVTEANEFAATVESNVKDETEAYTAKLDSELSVKIAKDLIAKLKF